MGVQRGVRQRCTAGAVVLVLAWVAAPAPGAVDPAGRVVGEHVSVWDSLKNRWPR